MRDYPDPPNSPRSSQAVLEEAIDLIALLSTLWRGKLWIALCAAFALLAGGLFAFVLATPIYTTTASVALETRQEQIVDIESVMSGMSSDQATVNTEVEVLRSRRLIGKVVDDLKLVNDPEFNPALREAGLLAPDKITAFVRKTILGEPVPNLAPTQNATRDAVINATLEQITVSNIRQTYVFNISAKAADPVKAAMIANRLAELYVEDQILLKFERTQEATIWLTDRVAELQVELETSESHLKAFGSNTDLISPVGLIALNNQLKDLRELQVDTVAVVERTRARADMLKDVLQTKDPVQMAAAASDTAIDRILTSATAKDAPDVVTEQFRQIVLRAELEHDRAAQQLAAITPSIADLTVNIEKQSDELVALQQLQRETEANRQIYEFFLGRLKETAVQQGLQQAESRILSQAIIPTEPSAPRKIIILALSLILGAMVGVAIVVLREMAQNTFRTAEHLEAKTGVPVVGQIPLVPARSRKKVLQYLQDKPNSAVAEAVRNLRTSLLLANLDRPPQVIMSTSSVPGEGKTTQSLSLALNLSGLGRKVLLIEGDIRRRVMNTYFDMDQHCGFLQVILGEVPFEEAVTQLPDMPFDVLFGAQSQTNAADIFSSEKFGAFLAGLREKYDFIIIDTPPVLAVADARIIGRWVDTTLYTVQWDKTGHRQVTEGLRSLEQVNVNVAGLVLGQISARGMKRYGYGQGYGDYGAYYQAS